MTAQELQALIDRARKEISDAARFGNGHFTDPRAALINELAVELERSEQSLAQAREDTARLDALEREVEDSPITLHNLPFGENIGLWRGLGMKPTRRTLRQAIDDLIRNSPAALLSQHGESNPKGQHG